MDYGSIKTPSRHRRLGSATLSQLALPGESDPIFPWEKSHWNNTVVNCFTVVVYLFVCLFGLVLICDGLFVCFVLFLSF